MIKLTLNGKQVTAKKGQTILQVAEDNGFKIPTLCHDKELKPFGSCWVCAVKVKGRRGFVTSCGTDALDGMVVETESGEVRNARKMALELLLSDHYADCEAPCKIACPDKVDVQTYVSLIANGQYHEAVKVIKENLPMPLSIGRVCPAFCEEECRRTAVEEPIAIRQLKRHAADFDLFDEWSYIPDKALSKNKSIAVIGGGPSGLTCGYYLSTAGFDVTVFEAAPKAGGWLRYGIPEYRLPKKILDQEIKLMCANGMKIKCNKKVGTDINLNNLSQTYDAVYLAIGAQNAVPMRVKGSDLKGCFLGVDFLKDVILGHKVSTGKKVAVVGGGNTAIDCARTAKRMGADVTLIYRRTRKEMPAEAYEVDAAEEEGIKFYFLTNPVENLGHKGKLKSIKLEKMKLGEPDSSGRRRPEPTGKFFEEEFSAVIAAISQAPDVEFLAEEKNYIEGKELPLTRWLTAVTDEETMHTGVANIFAGGDFGRGPATAIEAIADGRIAATSIERFLNGELMIDLVKLFDSKKAQLLKEIDPKSYEQYEKINRYKMPELDPKKRATNFKEVETGFADEDAKCEADRCLECGCQVNETCDLRKFSTEYNIETALFAGSQNQHPIDESHPFILRDANKCIKCGRCVRICSEVQGPGVLGFIYRGFASSVAPEFGESLTETSCESCGKCIEVCPVGALLPRNVNYKLNPHSTDITEQNCGICGTGCKVDVSVMTDKVTLVEPAKDEGFNGNNLCFGGRFGWQIYENGDRLKKPYKLNPGNMKNIEDFRTEVTDKTEIIDLIKENTANAETKKIYVSPTVTNEEIMLMKEVGKKLGAEVCSLSITKSFTDKLRETDLFHKKYEELDEAETIVIVGKISRTLKSLIRMKQKSGAKLIIISNEDNKFNQFADVLFDEEPIEDTLDKIIENYYEREDSDSEEEKIAPIELDLPEKTLFIYNTNNVSEEVSWNVWMLSSVVCNFKSGSGVLQTSQYANLNGLYKFGIKPGKAETTDFALLYGELPCEEQKGIIKNSKFILSINTHTDDNDQAHLILPGPSYLETEGTAIANDGSISKFANPKNSTIFDELLVIFYKAGLLTKAQNNKKHWLNKVKRELKANIELSEMSDEQLLDFLYTIENPKIDVPVQHCLQKNLIAKLKHSIKE
jgi:formate dehydrogenase major subunit